MKYDRRDTDLDCSHSDFGRFARTSGSFIYLQPLLRFEELSDISLKRVTFRWIFAAEFDGLAQLRCLLAERFLTRRVHRRSPPHGISFRELPTGHPQAT